MRKQSQVDFSSLIRLFSAAVFREMAKKGQSTLFRRLLNESNLHEYFNINQTVADVFDNAFEILKTSGCRDEYIYKAAIIQKLLLGRHSLRTASMLNEFRVGVCKADIVILNGTAAAYEIKSERDSLVRLFDQVESYKRVFAEVNVITGEKHVKNVLDIIPDEVGVMCLSKRYQITIKRKAVNCPERIIPASVFESLRVAEASKILQAMGVEVPQVPNTQKHAVMRNLFAKLDPTALHTEMVRTLKQTRSLAQLNDFVDRLPKSLRAAGLSISIPPSDHCKVIDAVNTPLYAAMKWS